MGSSKKADSRRLAGNSNLSLIQAKGAAIEKASEELRGTDTELDDLREQILAALSQYGSPALFVVVMIAAIQRPFISNSSSASLRPMLYRFRPEPAVHFFVPGQG